MTWSEPAGWQQRFCSRQEEERSLARYGRAGSGGDPALSRWRAPIPDDWDSFWGEPYLRWLQKVPMRRAYTFEAVSSSSKSTDSFTV